MQVIQRNKLNANSNAGRAAQYAMNSESRSSRFAKRLASVSNDAVHDDDDCAGHGKYDKISKQMDDIVEGESPKRFKRPKMESDIIAR